MPNRPFSPEEIEFLKCHNFKNLNRSKKSIRRKMIQLGFSERKFTIKSHKKNRWTNEEINLLKSSKNPEKLIIFERSQTSIRKMATRLGLIKKRPHRKQWSPKEVKILYELMIQDKKPSEIFKMKILSHSKTSIQKKMASLGLSKSEVVLINNLKKKEEKLIKKENYAELIRIARVEIMKKRLEENKDIWSGLCKQNFI